jgi:hypothetical protein
LEMRTIVEVQTLGPHAQRAVVKIEAGQQI